jgi:hypothetical protein
VWRRRYARKRGGGCAFGSCRRCRLLQQTKKCIAALTQRSPASTHTSPQLPHVRIRAPLPMRCLLRPASGCFVSRRRSPTAPPAARCAVYTGRQSIKGVQCNAYAEVALSL